MQRRSRIRHDFFTDSNLLTRLHLFGVLKGLRTLPDTYKTWLDATIRALRRASVQEIDRSAGVVRFDGFELRVRTGELFKDNERILRLSEQPLRVLVALLEHPGELVLREDLRKRLWTNDTVVEFEHSIGSAVNRLRQTLGDSAENSKFIETLARRGYRWKTPVEWVVPNGSGIPPVSESNPRAGSKSDAATGLPLENGQQLRQDPGALASFDLDAEVPRRQARLVQWKTALVTATALAVAVGAIIWFFLRSTTRHTPRDFIQHQLTVNSFENPVNGGSISPDGKYVAYNDLDGIHLKLVQTGEVQSIFAPEIYRGTSPNWEVGYWEPNSTHFFAVAELPQQPSTLWNISVTGSMQRIAEAANPWGVSPDGSTLASTRRNDQEIWLTRTNGTDARKILEGDDKTTFRAVQWSPDGQRIAYIRTQWMNGRSQSTIESLDLNGRSPTTIPRDASVQEVSQLYEGLRDLNWLPDGRLIYVGGAPDIHGMSCNLWEARIDSQTGEIISKPQRLTNWAGFCITDLTLTSDGKKLVFNRSSDLWTVYVADFDFARRRLSEPKKLTFTEDISSPSGWSADGSAVFIRSNREGKWGIYRQPLNGGTTESIVTGLEDVSWSTPLSFDGKWLFYGAREVSDPSEIFRLMRVALSGGPPQEIVRGRYGSLVCALNENTCVFAETTSDRKQISFFAFDLTKGKDRQLANLTNEERADELSWDLSPDGKQLVLFRDMDTRFRLLGLGSNDPMQEVQIDKNTHLRNLHWAADGKGVFASAPNQHAADLVYVDLHGNVHRLWQLKGPNAFLFALPSRDGRHLAIQSSSGTSNLWMLESF
jgi:eukaryotic-like serine/threonine-protein kinase